MGLIASTHILDEHSLDADGKTIATAASQMKIFNSDHKKIQKFTGHPVCTKSHLLLSVLF